MNDRSKPLAPSGKAAAETDVPWTHEEALEMGAILHDKFDVNAWKSAGTQPTPTEEEKGMREAILIELMDASSATLRAEDAEACRRYRKIAAEQGVDVP